MPLYRIFTEATDEALGFVFNKIAEANISLALYNITLCDVGKVGDNPYLYSVELTGYSEDDTKSLGKLLYSIIDPKYNHKDGDMVSLGGINNLSQFRDFFLHLRNTAHARIESLLARPKEPKHLRLCIVVPDNTRDDLHKVITYFLGNNENLLKLIQPIYSESLLVDYHNGHVSDVVKIYADYVPNTTDLLGFALSYADYNGNTQRTFEFAFDLNKKLQVEKATAQVLKNLHPGVSKDNLKRYGIIFPPPAQVKGVVATLLALLRDAQIPLISLYTVADVYASTIVWACTNNPVATVKAVSEF